MASRGRPVLAWELHRQTRAAPGGPALIAKGAEVFRNSLGPDHHFTGRAYGTLWENMKANGDPEYLTALRRAIGMRLRVSSPNEAETVVVATTTSLRESKAARPEDGGVVAIDELEAIGTDMHAGNERRTGRFFSNLG